MAGDISGGPQGSIATGSITGGSGGDLASATVAASNMVANTIDKGQLALATLQYVDVKIATAAIKTLFTTPVVLVPAQGAGLVVVVDSLWVTYVYGSATYACNASGASLFYKSDASGQAVGITVTQGFIQSASGTNFALIRGSSTLITDVTANLANVAVAIKAAVSDPTTGDGDMKFRVYYKVVPGPITSV